MYLKLSRADRKVKFQQQQKNQSSTLKEHIIMFRILALTLEKSISSVSKWSSASFGKVSETETGQSSSP